MTSFDHKRAIDLVTMGRLSVNLCSEQVGSTLEDAQTFRKYLGGCAGSIAIGSARLGLKTAVLSCVGVDAMGDFLVKRLVEEGVNIDYLQRSAHHLTAISLMGVNPPDDFPMMYFRENCADLQLNSTHITKELLKQTKALLVTGTLLSTKDSRETTLYALKLAQKCKTSIVFDCDFRPVLWKINHNSNPLAISADKLFITESFQSILPFCDIVIGTKEELQVAGGSESTSVALNKIRSLTDAVIVVETGDRGCEIYVDKISHPLSVPGFYVQVLNTLSAGDAFISGLLSAWLGNMSWQDCAIRANACGAITVTRHGASVEIPCLQEVQYFIDRYKTDPNICYQNTINYLHSRSLNHQNKESITLSFDHRSQFEQSCDDVGRAHSIIGAFKLQVLAGFLIVKNNNPNIPLGISVDMEHGSEVLREANTLGLVVNVPIETAGSFPVSWINQRPIYEQILKRPANWGVKIHWKYHPKLDAQIRFRQLSQLQLLAQVCESLDRELIVELTTPSGDYKVEAKYIAQSLEEVYEQNIFPDIWKVEPMESISQWQLIHEVIKQYDPSAQLKMWAANFTIYENCQEQFQIFKKTKFAGGFNIGRVVFWESWQHFLAGDISLDDVPDLVADNFQRYIDYWLEVKSAAIV